MEYMWNLHYLDIVCIERAICSVGKNCRKNRKTHNRYVP